MTDRGTRRLLPVEAFVLVFEPLVGKRIGFVRPIGNVGDDLIEWATLQLFGEFGIRWRYVSVEQPIDTDLDELVFGGGGNMGARYRNNQQLRQQALRSGLPLTILPQSFTSPEPGPFKRVYVRERASLALCPDAILAPDLALGLPCLPASRPKRGTGVFLRRDQERTGGLRWLCRDPVRECATPRAYLELAASYERIITDRLHFAIAALLAGRDTTLLANDYHKNQSMYETWLADLGCQFGKSASHRSWSKSNRPEPGATLRGEQADAA